MHIQSKVARYLHVGQSNFGKVSRILLFLWLAICAGENARGDGTATPQRVAHPLPAAVARLTPTGRLASTNHLSLAFSLPLRNQAALDSLLQQIYDPKSPQYHHYLTPAEFTAQFGPTEADYQATIRFAESHGLHVTATHPNRLLLDVDGAVPAIESALHVTFHTYQHPTENRVFYAPDTDPTLDLTNSILQISGLDNYERPHPHLTATPLTQSQTVRPNAGSGGNGTYFGKDFRAAYVPDTTLTGSGQSVGLLQFDGYTPADITDYVTQAGLPAVPLQNVLVDGFTGQPTGDGGEVEVSLDIEMANAMAPGLAKIIVYMAGPEGNWHDILNRMTTDNLARQLSCSWYIPGGRADTTADAIFQEMAAQGQTFLTASGDDDAYTGLINFPNDSPYITQVGGTTLTTTGAQGAYVSETAWNRNDGIGTGGGISTQYHIPTWQTNISMARNLGSTKWRNVPDVALTAENVYVRADGLDYQVGGTSCAAPLWAGFLALVNQQAAATGNPAMGFLNPALDAIGTGATYGTAFHDVTSGNNTGPGSGARFPAVAGYDLATGWGTPAGQNLINALANPEPLLITPTAGFTAAGGVGGPFTVASQTLTLTNSGTNALAWSLVNTSLWLTASPVSGSLLPGGPITTVTASLTATASNLDLGNYSTTLWFTNLNDGNGQSRVFNLSVIAPPAISTEPTNLTVLEGEAATFSVTATGGLPLAYQWQENGTNLPNNSAISGATTPNLVLNSVVAAQAGVFTVVVTNAAGAVTSTPALLTIPLSPPVFTLQPTNETFYKTQTAEFAVAVIGTEPYTYQWTFNATNLPNATNATLTLNNLQLTQSGNYAVVVSNSQGSTNSVTALLTVNPPPPCAPVDSGMVSWWAGEDNANDTLGLNNGTLVGGATYVTGEVGQAFQFDGTSGYVSIPDSPSLDAFTTNITIELWVKINQTTPNADWRGIVTKGNSSWRLQGTSGSTTVNFAGTGLSINLTGNKNINDEMWHHVAAVYDGANMYIYVDGTLDASAPATGSIAQNNYPLCLGYNAEKPIPTANYYLNGAVDEVAIFNRPLSAQEIQLIYLTGAGGKCQVPLSIISQPASQTAYSGTNVTLTVVATGVQPINYQWEFNGTNLAGATNNVLLLTNVQPVNGGTYSVTVTNPNGSLTSSNAVLTVVTQPPFIITQPASQTNYAGTTASFMVVAGGSLPLSYQWMFDSTNLAGATNATLILSSVQFSQAGNYTVTISSPYGLTNSGVAVLTIDPPPPCAPEATGLVDWWAAEDNTIDNMGNNNGTLVGGATYANGEVGQAFLFDGSSGYVSISDSPSLDVATTNITIELWLKVNQTTPNSDWRGIVSKGNLSWQLEGIQGSGAVAFTINPTDPGLYGTRNINDGLWHHVAGVYDGSHLYIYVDGSLDTSTATTATFVAQTNDPLLLGANPHAPQPYYFNGLVDEVSIYNRALSAQQIQTIYLAGSNGKCLLPVAITSQPTNETVLGGNSATFAVSATGSQPIKYQWNINGTNIFGATNSTLTLVSVQPTNAGNYTVTVANPSGTLTSSNAMLTVLTSPPVITSQPLNQTNIVGTTATFSVTATGGAPLQYQWIFGLFNINGATNATLILTNVQLAQAGNYSVQVSNSYGSTNSVPAVLAVTLPPTCVPTTSGLMDWWSGESNAYDNIGNNNGTLVGGATYANGEVGQAFLFDGSSGYVSIPDSASLDVATTNITIELWLKVNQTTPNSDWRGIVSKGNLSWQLEGIQGSGAIAFTINPTDPGLFGTRNVNDGLWHHVAGVYDGSYLYIYVDGSLDTSTPTTTTFVAQTNDPLLLGANPHSPLPYYFNGLVDEVSVYDRALSAQQIQGIYNAGIAGKCPLPITIINQPTNETVLAQTSATFAVSATGSKPIKYQWNFNGTNIIGATNSSLTLVNLQPTNTGNYTVTLTNPSGTLTSSNALLTVIPTPPIITSEPLNQTNTLGTTATFSVTATGGVPLQYQWSFGLTNISGATNATLTLKNVQITQAGNYFVQVSNPYGRTNSTVAVLVVNLPPPSCVPISPGLGDWWAAEGNTIDNMGKNNGTLIGGATYANGEVGKAFLFDGSSGYVSIPDSSSLDAATTNITVELWLKVNQTSVNSDWTGIISKGNLSWQMEGIQGAGSVFFGINPTDPGVLGTRNVNDGMWHHVAGVYDGFHLYIYVDGTLDASTATTKLVAQTSDPLLLGANPHAPLPYYFNGLVDEVSIYNQALSAQQIQAIYLAGNNGKCPLPITISLQPTNETAMIGTTTTLLVAASGSQPFNYQWMFNGTNILNATNISLTLTNVQYSNMGNYAVTIANPAGTASSSNALLTVTGPPVITTQPSSQTNLTGNTVTFIVAANGPAPFGYQWHFNNINLPGATSPTLTLTNLAISQAGNYSVLVTNQYGYALSSNAVVVVNPSLHFLWNVIPSPRFVSTPFNVVVQAQDATNDIVTNFTSSVTLNSTDGMAILPATSGNFISGVWTGTVTVAQTATNLVLQATDSLGDTGLANPVNIVNLPSLTTVTSSSTLLLLWPLTPAGFVLETTSDLTQSNWLQVTTPPFQIGGQNLLPIPTSGTNAFFRLRFPGP